MKQKFLHFRIVRGWHRIGRTLAAPMLALAAIVLISGGIVLPLWFLATRAPAAYGVLVLSVVGISLLILLLRNVHRREQRSSHNRRRSGAVWLATVVAAVGAYATLLVYSYVGLLGALPLFAVLVASIGYTAGGGNTGRE